MASAASAKRFVEPILHALRQVGIDAELCTEHQTATQAFENELPASTNSLSFNLGGNPFADAWRLMRTIAFLLAKRPPIVHAHQSRSAFIPLLASYLTRVPIRIYHNHGSAFWGSRGLARAAFWLLERVNCSVATHVLFVNSRLREEFIRYRIVSRSKCHDTGPGSICGLDLAAFPKAAFTNEARATHRKVLRLPTDAFVALYVGRPFRRKGFHFLLNAWERSFDREGSRLILAGCSDRDVADVLGRLPRTVVALGYVIDMQAVYCAADVLILPSEHEGFPYALLEAAAADRCLIGSNAPGLDTMLKHNNTGLEFQLGDQEAFAAVLNQIKDDIALRTRLAHGARARAEQFDRIIVLKGLLDLYESLCQRNNAN